MVNLRKRGKNVAIELDTSSESNNSSSSPSDSSCLKIEKRLKVQSPSKAGPFTVPDVSTVGPCSSATKRTGFRSASSIPQFYKAMSLLTDDQKKTVEKMGFTQLLRLQVRRFKRDFMVDLCQAVDVGSSSLDFGERGRVTITDRDVSYILGIPLGREIIRINDRRTTANRMSWKQMISAVPSSGSAREFKVLFLRLACASLLYPTTLMRGDIYLYDLIEYDLVDRTSRLNWCEFVRVRLLNGIQHWKYKRMDKDVNISGCLVFLILFYVCKMKISPLGRIHNSMDPTFWTTEKISKRIKAEKRLANWCLGIGEPQIFPVTAQPIHEDAPECFIPKENIPFMYRRQSSQSQVEQLCEELSGMTAKELHEYVTIRHRWIDQLNIEARTANKIMALLLGVQAGATAAAVPASTSAAVGTSDVPSVGATATAVPASTSAAAGTSDVPSGRPTASASVDEFAVHPPQTAAPPSTSAAPCTPTQRLDEQMKMEEDILIKEAIAKSLEDISPPQPTKASEDSDSQLPESLSSPEIVKTLQTKKRTYIAERRRTRSSIAIPSGTGKLKEIEKPKEKLKKAKVLIEVEYKAKEAQMEEEKEFQDKDTATEVVKDAQSEVQEAMEAAEQVAEEVEEIVEAPAEVDNMNFQQAVQATGQVIKEVQETVKQQVVEEVQEAVDAPNEVEKQVEPADKVKVKVKRPAKRRGVLLDTPVFSSQMCPEFEEFVNPKLLEVMNSHDLKDSQDSEFEDTQTMRKKKPELDSDNDFEVRPPKHFERQEYQVQTRRGKQVADDGFDVRLIRPYRWVTKLKETYDDLLKVEVPSFGKLDPSIWALGHYICCNNFRILGELVAQSGKFYLSRSQAQQFRTDYSLSEEILDIQIDYLNKQAKTDMSRSDAYLDMEFSNKVHLLKEYRTPDQVIQIFSKFFEGPFGELSAIKGYIYVPHRMDEHWAFHVLDLVAGYVYLVDSVPSKKNLANDFRYAKKLLWVLNTMFLVNGRTDTKISEFEYVVQKCYNSNWHDTGFMMIHNLVNWYPDNQTVWESTFSQFYKLKLLYDIIFSPHNEVLDRVKSEVEQVRRKFRL